MRKYRLFCVIIGALFTLSMIGSIAHGDDSKYESRGRRDPFVPLVGIDVPKTSKLEEITSINDIKLEGIASRQGGKMVAILNGEIVKEGDKFGEIEIDKITKKTVAIKLGGKDYEIELSEEGGLKSGR